VISYVGRFAPAVTSSRDGATYCIRDIASAKLELSDAR
jgi:hypothetical protein